MNLEKIIEESYEKVMGQPLREQDKKQVVATLEEALTRIATENGKAAVAWMNERNGFICKEKARDYHVPLAPYPSIPPDMTLVPLHSTKASLQARLDELMLEYCPEEMTTEQTAEWARCQEAVKC